jgi:hypothetical protein
MTPFSYELTETLVNYSRNKVKIYFNEQLLSQVWISIGVSSHPNVDIVKYQIDRKIK